MPPKLEHTGWSRIDISAAALDSVAADVRSRGLEVESYSIAPHLPGYTAYLELPEYAGEYRNYGGTDRHCLLEKSIEHFLSLILAQPRPGQLAIDIGSCLSVVPGILRRLFQVRCYEQDLVYPAGVHGDRIGSSADAIPLPDQSVDFMTLHCTFEHFEGQADSGFVRECGRLLKPGGRTIILPLYLNANHCNITGEKDEGTIATIGFDPDASYHCAIPEWQNRFGRHYSPSALMERVIHPAREAGLKPRLLRCVGWEDVDPRLWLRWILVLEKPSGDEPAESPVAPPVQAAPVDRTQSAALRFAPPGHFYSPHPRLEDLEQHIGRDRALASRPDGLDLNEGGQVELLQRVAQGKPTGPWSDSLQARWRYHYDNHFFRFGDSNALWHVAQIFQPRRVIEVGSGYSTACWLDTFDALGLDSQLTCIEPYPDRVHQLCRPEDLAKRLVLLQRPVQEIPLETFAALQDGDVLFIDSTHVAKSGSDVNYLVFHVLPNLAPGVVVHIHDIFWPFDYPLEWYQEGRAWNESFLVRAFLQHNAQFRVIRFNSYLAQRRPDALGGFDPRFVSDAGGSLWLVRNR